MVRLRIKYKSVNKIPELIKVLKEIDRYGLEVGVFSADDKKDPSYVMIASVHEFGVTIQKEKGSIVIPERSFIRSTFDEKNDEWFEFMKKQLLSVLTFKFDALTFWERLGAKIVADIQEKITDLDTPPNAPSTIAKKGSSNPLIDTGGLRSRITYKVVSK